MSKSRKKKKPPKRVLALPDLEQAKSAVLNTLTSRSGQRTYDHAINEFVEWYCSEPRLAFNRTVVLRYRISLEQKQYAPSTINLRLAAVRRVAYEAADSGLLSPELAAGIRRVKGVRRLGIRVGNWLTAEQPHDLRRTCARLCHFCRWRIGSDSIPAGECVHPNHGAVPRVQTEASSRRERQAWNRTGRKPLNSRRWGRYRSRLGDF